MVHHLNIGAMWMGTRGWGVEIYQEGFRVPPLKLVEEGRLDQKVLAFMLNNTRVPETLENDLISQLSSVQAAGDDLGELFRRYGADVLAGCFDALIDYSERRTRAAIEVIPDGVYSHSEPLLDDGAKGGPYWLRLAITKEGGDITFDFTGTDGQIEGPINAPLATTWATIYYVMRCITDPSIPSNEGCKRPIHAVAPPGTLVNTRKPAAVYQRMIVCHSLVDLAMGALGDAVPDRVMADSCGCGYNYTILTDPDQKRQVMFGEVVPGGIGATTGADGIKVMSCHVTNCPVPPIEATEIEAPVLYLKRALREDTGGAGRWRGGVGQVLAYKVLGEAPRLYHTSQKSHSLPQGMGDGGRWVINEGTADERVLEFATGDLEP
jgi:N-methylhydantoinase B